MKKVKLAAFQYMYGFVCKILLDSPRFFCCSKVNFNLQKTSAEVNSVYFLSLFRWNVFRLLIKTCGQKRAFHQFHVRSRTTHLNTASFCPIKQHSLSAILDYYNYRVH